MGSNCPICFEDFSEKIRASPDACDHIFCLPCLEKWSKLGSFCPIDRKRYKKIVNLDSSGTIPVKPRKRKRKQRTLYDFSTSCEVCSKDENDDVLLLCDCCDLGFHMFCLSPPLKEVPAGLWFCPTCVTIEKRLKEKKGITKEDEANFSIEKKIKAIKKEKYDSNTSSEDSKKDNSILQACRNIITEFEDITVERNCSRNVPSSSCSNDSSDQVDKICKTFDAEAGNSGHKHSNYFKGYCLRHRNKSREPCTQNQAHDVLNIKIENSNVDDTCFKDSISDDISLKDCLYRSENCGYMKSDAGNEDDFYVCETKMQRSSLNEEYNHKFSFQLEHQDNTEISIEEKLSGEKSKVTENADGFMSLNYSISEGSSKGSYNSLSSKQMTKEKLHFSVFDKIDDIDTSQKKYSEINSVIDNFFSSNLYTRHCSLCKDVIFVKSQEYCKLCKLKYLKKPVNNRKYSKSTKDLKHSPDSNGYRGTSKRNDIFGMIDCKRNTSKKYNIDDSERCRRSLLRKLKKICNSK